MQNAGDGCGHIFVPCAGTPGVHHRQGYHKLCDGVCRWLYTYAHAFEIVAGGCQCVRVWVQACERAAVNVCACVLELEGPRSATGARQGEGAALAPAGTAT